MNKDALIFRISFKSEGKEVERKRKRNKMGGGLIVNIFFGVEIFSSGVVIFLRGLRNFLGGGVGVFEKFSGGGGGWGGLRNFWGWG